MSTDEPSADGPRDVTPIFQPFETASLAERIRDQVLQLIADNRLVAGERLPSEREIARQLGVSRPAVREAMSALSSMNVIDIRPGSGAYVTGLEVDRLAEPIEWIFLLNPSSIHELFDVRRPIEVRAAVLAAQQASAADVTALSALLDRMEAAAGDPVLLDMLDREFHLGIALAGGNRLLAEFVQVVNGLASRSRRDSYAMLNRTDAALRQHRAVVEAISMGDPEAAEDAMASHLRDAERNLNTIADVRRHDRDRQERAE